VLVLIFTPALLSMHESAHAWLAAWWRGPVSSPAKV
jgi:hypothetical protein